MGDAQVDLWSSVEMQTSTMSDPNARLGGNMTWERPLKELTGVPDESEEAEEVESEPWEDDFWLPFATLGGKTQNITPKQKRFIPEM